MKATLSDFRPSFSFNLTPHTNILFTGVWPALYEVMRLIDTKHEITLTINAVSDCSTPTTGIAEDVDKAWRKNRTEKHKEIDKACANSLTRQRLSSSTWTLSLTKTHYCTPWQPGGAHAVAFAQCRPHGGASRAVRDRGDLQIWTRKVSELMPFAAHTSTMQTGRLVVTVRRDLSCFHQLQRLRCAS